MRRPATPILLAWFAIAAGLVTIVSALTPEAADRLDLVRGVLPPGVPSAARTLALALGFGMIWLSRGLARRKRRAWYLAVAVVAASAVAHLAKGLDFEEATVHLALLVALFRARRRFVAPGDPTTVLPLVQVGLALAICVPLLAVYLHDNDAYSERIEIALLILIGGLAIRAFWLWFRPFPVAPPEDDERERAAELVQEHGSDSLAYFALRRDKCYFFSPSGKSFLAYRLVGSTALVAGDPIGEEAERHDLLAEFLRVAHTKGWRVAVAGASSEALADYVALGFKSIYLGDEAVIRPAEFTLEGRAIRKVRQSVSRLEKNGYAVRVLSTADAGEPLRCDLREVSEEWRGNWPERGFTMAMDALFLYPDTVLAVAIGPDGSVGGFLQLVPSPASEGYSLASMRRRKDTPNGLMEYLITETVSWAREHAVMELSLNFAVFADFLHAEEAATRWSKAFRWLLLKADRLFQVERLHSFNRKFFPRWRRRYFCFERWGDFPLAGLAYLHAESLLTPPLPWVKTQDLTAQ
ncbi:MAG: phosphatidylglycerol lysyltransferase domain-containing protein [Actinomycetota bacterium]|nr:phosphatidylglycerol lysyltransferase domain-containing protein [Actinomycetota bacterium]